MREQPGLAAGDRRISPTFFERSENRSRFSGRAKFFELCKPRLFGNTHYCAGPALSLPYTPPTTVPGGVSYYPPGSPWYGQNGQQPGTQMETRTYANYYKTNFVEDLRLALFAGLFLNIGLNPKWSIEPGLSYVQKGIRLRSTVTRYLPDQNTQQRVTYDNAIHTNYIVMSVVAKYNLGRRERVFLLGGIYNALAVRSRGVFQGTTETAYPLLGTINPGYNPDASYTPSSGYWQRDNDRPQSAMTSVLRSVVACGGRLPV